MIDSFTGKYRFLSNFESLGYSIRYRDVNYATVEHAYQAAKTNDLKWKDTIRNAASASIAKKLGKIVELRPDWDLVKLEIMEELLRIKFSNSYLRVKLLATYPNVLIEGNTWGDRYWGMCREYSTISEGIELVGENHLGKLLMKIREQVKEDSLQD